MSNVDTLDTAAIFRSVDAYRAECARSASDNVDANRNANTCSGCGCAEDSYVVDMANDIIICTNCGSVDSRPAGCTWDKFNHCTVYWPLFSKGRSAGYNATFYSNEKLRNANATDPKCYDSYIEAAKLYGYYLTGGQPEQLSKERIRRISKILDCPRFGERWWQTKKRVCNMAENENCISEDVIAWLRRWFENYKQAFKYMREHNMFPDRASKNLLNYNYVYTQWLHIHDYVYGTRWHALYGWWFSLVKTEKRIQKCDSDWKLIIDFLNEHRNTDLPYIPLSQASKRHSMVQGKDGHERVQRARFNSTGRGASEFLE